MKRIAFLMLILSCAALADCEDVYSLAYNLQKDRQHNIYRHWDPESIIEHDIKNAVWQRPRYRSDKMKEHEAKRFADDWKSACENGYYK